MSGAANQQESEKESESESETESENQSESEIFQPETEPASGEIDDSRPDNTSYSVYTEQLKNIISQLESDIKGQEQVKDVLEAYDLTEKDSSCEALTETIEGDQRVLDSLKEIQEKMTKYQTLISSVMSMWGSDESIALVGEPAILLADEPTGALDQISGKEVLKLFHRLHEMGNTIVMITHDLGVAQHAQRIVKIMDGELLEE